MHPVVTDRPGCHGDSMEPMRRPTRSKLLSPGRAAQVLVFVLTALPLGAIALAVVISGWSLTLALVVTPLSVGALVGFAVVLRALADAESAVASALLGVSRTRAVPAGGRGYWRRGPAILTDRSFWQQQVYLVVRIVLGWPMGVAVVSLFGSALGLIAAPIYYRWLPMDGGGHGFDFGIWRADTFVESLALVPAGLVLLAAVYALLTPIGALWRRIAIALLRADKMKPMIVSSHRQGVGRRAVVVHGIATLALAVLLTGIWGLTTRAYYWPFWPTLVLSTVWTGHAWVQQVDAHTSWWRRPRMTKALALHGGLTVILLVFLVLVWAATTRWYFWPAWPALGLLVAVGVHWLAVVARRIEHLESARAGAVAVQENDLRRIERDLHDGAQARLVSLGMSLGLADQRFEADPEGARQLVREARSGVTDALAELRNLVRGIRPPVLADRGLGAAIGAVVDQCPIPVDVYVNADPRPPDAIETAAYFVVAECIANAAKHAEASRLGVRIERWSTQLRLEVIDDGRGGANANGPGLLGLRRRVEAVEGTFSVSSPVGGPTVIRAELPCES